LGKWTKISSWRCPARNLTRDEEGHPVYFIVKALEPETVVIDFNHPLAGKEVEFAITLKSVREATPEDLQGCTCAECGGSHPHEH